MKDLFKIDFEFLGNRVQIQVMLYNKLTDAREFTGNKDYDNDACFCVIAGDRQTYILLQADNFDKVYVYSHELLHAVKYYLIDRYNIEDEECECYMLGYLMQIYTDFLAIHMKQEAEEEAEPVYNDYYKKRSEYDNFK